MLRDSIDWAIYVSGAALFALSIAAFFFSPAYEKGAWVGIVAFSSAFSGCLGAKFGLSQAQQINSK
jgi:hypothetical protein